MFELGQDFYSDHYLSEKLSAGTGIALICLVFAFIGLHMLRRAFGTPQRNDAAEVPPQASRFERYELGARLYHWGNLLIILGLVVSGASFFFPGSLFALLPVLGVSWLTFHVVLAGLFVLGFFAHIVAAIGWGDLWSMWFERRDWRDLIVWTRYYLGQDVAIPKTGKYDVIQKLYHFCLAALAMVMIATGTNLFLNAEILAQLDFDWLRWQRLLHDAGAFLFAAIVIGHMYLRLIPSRWPEFIAMLTGRIEREEFLRRFDWRRWRPRFEA
jgi:cytochrome b subunit of formate dehydrogenase